MLSIATRIHDAIFVTVVVVALVLAIIAEAQEAPYEEHVVGEKGRFKKWVRNVSVTWHQARDACIAHGGWLAVDLSQETHVSLTSVPGGDKYAWLGGHDVDVDGVWRWVTGPAGKEDNGRGRVFWMANYVSGTGKDECFYQDCFWLTNEPNNYGDGEAYLMTYNKILWNDLDPNSRIVKHYYCEYPVPPEPPAAEAKNYQLFSRPNGISWYEARQTCTVFGGILASELDIKSKTYITEIGRSMGINNGTAFLGGTDYSVRGEWRWITGAAQEEDNNRGRLFYSTTGGICKVPPGGEPSIGCRWAPSNPSVSQTNASFVAIQRTGTSSVKWVSLTYPAKATGFVCEFPITATSSPSATLSPSPTASVSPDETKSMTPTPSTSSSATLSHPTPSHSVSLTLTPSISPSPTTSRTGSTSLSSSVSKGTRTPSSPITATPSLTSSMSGKTSTPTFEATQSASQTHPTSSQTLPPTHSLSLSQKVASPTATSPPTRSATATAHFYAFAIMNVTDVNIDDLIRSVWSGDNVTTSQQQHKELSVSAMHINIRLDGNDQLIPPYSEAMDRSRDCLAEDRLLMSIVKSDNATISASLGQYFTAKLYVVGGQSAVLMLKPKTQQASVRGGGSPRDDIINRTVTFEDVPLTNISLSNDIVSASTTITIAPGCLQYESGDVAQAIHFVPTRLEPPPFVTEAPPIPIQTPDPEPTPAPKVVSQPFLDGTGDTATTITLVSGAITSPTVASQASRSMIVLTLAECTPSVDRLPSVQSPTRFKLGDSKVSYYVGGTIMNHVVLVGVGIIQLIAAKIYQRRKNCSFDEAKQKMRFPSLLAFFAMFLLEPTSMCCWVTLTHAPDLSHRIIAGFSFAACLAVPAIAYILILRDNVFKGKYHENWDEDPDNPDRGLETRNKVVFFFFGTSKWKDQPDNEGFCQKTRLFFCDYKGTRPITRSFLVVEMLIAILIGSLDGIKLGVGKCDGILVSLLIVFTLYIIAIVVLRPYNAYFLMAFTLTMTSMQLFGAVLLALGMFNGLEGASDAAEYTSVICLYLVIGRVFFDLGPKLFRGYKGMKKAQEKKRGRSETLKGGLLSEPLIVASGKQNDDTDSILVMENDDDPPPLFLDSSSSEDTESDDGFKRGEFDMDDADARFRKQLSDEEFQRLLAAAASNGETVSAEDRDLLLARLEAMSERELLVTLVDRLQQLNGKGYRSALHTALESDGVLGGGQLLSTLQHTRGLESIVLRQKILERERQAEEKEREKKGRANKQLMDILDGLDELDEEQAFVAKKEAEESSKAERSRLVKSAASPVALTNLAAAPSPTNKTQFNDSFSSSNSSTSSSDSSSDYYTTSDDGDEDLLPSALPPSGVHSSGTTLPAPSSSTKNNNSGVPHAQLNAADLELILDETKEGGTSKPTAQQKTYNMDVALDGILQSAEAPVAERSTALQDLEDILDSSSSSSDVSSTDSLMQRLRDDAI